MRALLLVALVACGTTTLPAGAACQQSSECEGGLSCVDVAQFSGTSCTVVGKACSIICQDDNTCSTLGTHFKCFAGCGADKSCGEIP